MQTHAPCRVALVLSLSLWSSTEAVAQSAAPVGFVEVPGDREFSGRVIVRPIQLADWRSRGLGTREAATRHRSAEDFARTFEVVDYVEATDEFIVLVPEGLAEVDVARRFENTKLFEYVEPDWILFPASSSNDPQLATQWHHDATKLQSCSAWDLQTGYPSISIGICDGGIETTHEEFLLHRREGYNAVSQLFESQGGLINAVNDHGVFVTGCAAANGNNGAGGSGIGWNFGHRMCRVTNSAGGGALVSALNRAARTSIESGDRVTNVSYSGPDLLTNLASATYIKSIGGLMVWSAGNAPVLLTLGNRDDDDLIVVGGTDQNDNLYTSSARGRFVDLVAPAVSVYSTTTSNGYTTLTGTSYASPMVAGLAALLWASDPSLTPDDVETYIKLSCVDLGAAGVDEFFGYGRIDSNAALTLLGADCGGSHLRYGAGLGGSGGYTPDLNLAGCPVEGNTISLEVAGGLGGASGALIFGASSLTVPIFGGTLLVNPVIAIPQLLSGPGNAGVGTASLPIAIPVGTASFLLYVQGVYVDAGAVQGASLTQGLTFTIG